MGILAKWCLTCGFVLVVELLITVILSQNSDADDYGELGLAIIIVLVFIPLVVSFLGLIGCGIALIWSV